MSHQCFCRNNYFVARGKFSAGTAYDFVVPGDIALVTVEQIKIRRPCIMIEDLLS